MTKSELIERVASRQSDWTRQTAEDAVNILFGTIANALERGDRIEIRGLGSFQVKSRMPRVGRNPKTGMQVPIPAQRVPSFTAGKLLKARVQAS